MWSLCSFRKLSSSSSLIGDIKSISYLPFSSRFAASLSGSSNHVVRGEKHSPSRFGVNLSLLSEQESVSTPYALTFQKSIHSADQKDSEMGKISELIDFARARDSEMGRNSGPMGFARGRGDEMGRNPRQMDFLGNNSEMGRSSRPMDFMRKDSAAGRSSRPMDFMRNDSVAGRSSRPMDFVRGIIEQENSRVPRYKVEQNTDFVLINIKRSNAFINVLDAKGNTKYKVSSGFTEIGGGRTTRYSAEAAAEFVGRKAREMGLKSVVMRVKGFTHFKKKRQAIVSFKEGFSTRNDRNPITYIEDVTQRAHNGCRLPRKRRV
ncbi:uncharacterized protein LOC126660526 [Mercurialis annua]|uniref:uncharacterized protein LOC126660526 n=1 Tax=Mercurialis annua TaxID=3986 RepID=UPI0024AFEFB5|nr:uncharacterized protein LOC126660526 [Mercurialis annua]